MMNQFRVERNQYGNLYVYCRLFGMSEQCVAMRQYDRNTNQWS